MKTSVLPLRLVFAALAACMSVQHGNAAEKAVTPDPLAALLLERLDAEGAPTCLIVGVVDEATRVHSACSKGAGPVAFDSDSLFEIGSITKGFTGLLLADMVRKGEVTLQDPVSKYAPAGAKLPTFREREITLGDLVTQTSALPRMPPGFTSPDPRNPYATYDAKALYESLARTELQREIGSQYEYSNFGFMWLSELLARRGGKPYPALLDERVLKPLAMSSTVVNVPAEMRKRIVPGHDSQYRVVSAWDIPAETAGVGGLKSSMNDMLKLAEALAGWRDTPLKETIDLALTSLRPIPGPWRSIAYGWHLTDKPGARIVAHNGGTGGFRSIIVVNRDMKTAAVVLVDSNASFDDLALHLVDGSAPLKKKRVAIEIDDGARAEYAGVYQLTPGFSITVFADGKRLMTQATNQGPVEIFAEARDRFFLRVVDAQLDFTRGADGAIEGLVLHQGGRDVPGRRLK
jgi:D-alanyl-D-alanine-carboxypeptidase/D-alanyl-D-alanine-endopeptidase